MATSVLPLKRRSKIKSSLIGIEWSVPCFDNHNMTTVTNSNIEASPNLSSKYNVATIIGDTQNLEVPEIYANTKLEGDVTVTALQSGKPFAADSIVVELMCNVELNKEYTSNILSSRQFLERSTVTLSGSKVYHFDFSENLPLMYESVYTPSSAIKIRYFLALSVLKAGKRSLEMYNEIEFAVKKFEPIKKNVISEKNEFNYEHIVHLEMEFSSMWINIQKNEPILGSIFVLMVGKTFEKAELRLERREHWKSEVGGEYQTSPWRILYNQQIVEGPLVKGERIPIRIFVENVDNSELVPSLELEMAYFEYCVVVELIDCEGKKYFKAFPIKFYRGI